MPRTQCALVFAMVVVGGITRLTHSGLSMVEWQPIVGTIPPLDQAQWQEVFEKYQRTPQYQKVNHGMSLEEFKGIFWWEYIHRLLGRAIGVAFFIPLLYFVIRARVDGALAWRLLLIFVLGGLQGALGWYMVKSGLADRVSVSQYRLVAHLALALAIYGLTLWIALGILAHGGEKSSPGGGEGVSPMWRRAAEAVIGLVALTIAAGGFVAGLKAGLTGVDAERTTWTSLTDAERQALVNHDHVTLFEMGAHPFLTLTLFIAMFERDHGPLEYQIAYGRAMEHLALPYPDIAT